MTRRMDQRVNERLQAVTVEDLLRHRIIAEVHVADIEMECRITQQSVWDVVRSLGLKPAILTDLELETLVQIMHEDHPSSTAEELLGLVMKQTRGGVNPTQAKIYIAAAKEPK